MKNNKFSFVRWLTNRDVEKLVQAFGYEVMTQKDNPDKPRISRYKDKETGENHIHVFCKDLISMEARKVAMEGLREIGVFRDMLNQIGMISAMLGAMGGSDYSFGQMNDIVMLDITDFFVFEELSLKEEQEQIDNNRRMIKIYQNYMSKKFGRFYNGMKSAEYKRVHKEVREEEAQKQEVEKTEENNEETIEK